MFTYVYVCTTNACRSFRGHWKVSDPLELDFQAVVSCLTRVPGTKCWPCVFSPLLPLFWPSQGGIVRPCLKSNYNRLLPQLALQRIRVQNFRAHSEPGQSEGERSNFPQKCAQPHRQVQSVPPGAAVTKEKNGKVERMLTRTFQKLVWAHPFIWLLL